MFSKAVAGAWEKLVFPTVLSSARARLEEWKQRGELPRVALVKQDCNEDLYCCETGADAISTLRSTLLRSGPASLFSLFDARFFIVRTERDPECSIWQEKSDPLAWAPTTWFESFRDHVPGRDHGQSKFARAADEIAWCEFDLVISVDVSVPARITAHFPQVVWAYYVREIKAPSWHTSFDAPLAGQDLYLSQVFEPHPPRRRPHVVDFPYHFQHCGVFHELADVGEFDAKRRHGVFVEYHTARHADPSELRQLAEIGPVYACRPEHDRLDPVTGERIPERSMAPEGFGALTSSKYHVKWGGRAIFGTAKVESIAAGCLSVCTRNGDGTPFLQSSATSADDFPSLLAALRKLEASHALYAKELARQRRLVDYLCCLRPANDLITAWRRVRRERNSA